MNSMWSAYVKEVAGVGNQDAVAELVGQSQPTISRWMNGTKVPTEPARVALFARGYKRNVLEAFVAAGMLTEQEASTGLSDESRFLLRRLSRVADKTYTRSERTAAKNRKKHVEDRPEQTP